MTWFKVDDHFRDHPKVRQLGRSRLAAVGLWTLVGNWCADNPSDGFAPVEVVRRYSRDLRLADRLVQVGLWEEAKQDGEIGYQFHDWLDVQPSAKEQAEKRRKRREAGRLGGVRSGESRRRSSEASGSSNSASKNEANANPVPSRTGSGYLGGKRSDDQRVREQRPPDRCAKHQDDPTPPPCGQCADARRAAQLWDTRQAERGHQAQLDVMAAIRACPFCDAAGFQFEFGRRIPMTPYVKCDHGGHTEEQEST
jgi:hypothetical protein